MAACVDRKKLGALWRGAATLAMFLTFAAATPVAAVEMREFPTKKVPVMVETIASDLEHPWAIEVLPSGDYLVSERPGRMRIIHDGKISPPIAGVPKVYSGGQGGLLDVALDPDFESSRKLYFSASIRGEGGQGTAIFSARLSDDGRSLDDVKRIFAMNRFTTRPQHFGSRIAIAPDGSLFFGIGDRGSADRAQDLRDHAGSILHINADGTIPASNPYLGSTDGLPEIWSKGHRNPQGITFDPKENILYTVEHGARGGDEINKPEPGKNYGWPVISYGKHYSGAEIGEGTAKEGYEQPLHYWDPSIAPGAIAIYRGAMFPEWDGDYLVAALKYELLARLEHDDTGEVVAEERLFKGEFDRMRDVKVAPDGSILLLTDSENGSLLRILRSDLH
ncbi:PQQ-dependent sugar dehydrogenase [Rhizobiaceae bacterium n13]|uniref:PQQ-dependent sugar dehydrogenase n=1 Tax=Ferirhizobium litorale TaxID=2927786 RepID=A0AAE3TZJ5_9HYPH|nr:PQQ-dependent sugar dehydrogenase [Fererhizobium litorale]MDI7860906.1 PQQ-dependent sugar dehydrogenase [Fererhizobium litorale]MDI7921054.1 PQQ-dependent sugar dehydrogenase [Fererhizobium litorale]